MARRTRDTGTLAPSTLSRLAGWGRSHGYTLEQVRADPELLRAARGHGATPEHGWARAAERVGLTVEEARRHPERVVKPIPPRIISSPTRPPEPISDQRLHVMHYQQAGRDEYGVMSTIPGRGKASSRYHPMPKPSDAAELTADGSDIASLKMWAPPPRDILRALRKVDSDLVAVGVLVLWRKSNASNMVVEWTGFVVGRSWLEGVFADMARGWADLSIEEQHARQVAVVVELAAEFLQSDPVAVLGWSFKAASKARG